MNEFYQIIEEKDLQHLLGYVHELPQGSAFLELGAFTCGTSVQLALANPTITVYAVERDPTHAWLDYPGSETRAYLESVYPGISFSATNAVRIRESNLSKAPNVKFVVADSRSVIPREPVRGCFIDADHSRDSVVADFFHCYQLSEDGSTIFGDDYSFKSVKEAVARIAAAIDQQPMILSNQLWAFRIKD